VVLSDTGKGLSKQAHSDTNGSCVFSQLAPSTYDLEVELAGFANAASAAS